MNYYDELLFINNFFIKNYRWKYQKVKITENAGVYYLLSNYINREKWQKL